MSRAFNLAKQIDLVRQNRFHFHYPDAAADPQVPPATPGGQPEESLLEKNVLSEKDAGLVSSRESLFANEKFLWMYVLIVGMIVLALGFKLISEIRHTRNTNRPTMTTSVAAE